MRERPEGDPVMFQRWRTLTFLHVAVDPAEIQALLPEGLTVDTFPDADGVPKAWLGLVPFRMEGIRPRGVPAVPWLSAFPETNVRTYVHAEGAGPGVWFFSLDAARWLACRIARGWFGLPYFHAQMGVREGADGRVAYRSQRAGRSLEIEVEAGGEVRAAEAGTLDFFLVERYLLYAERGGRLWRGRVWHAPYELSGVSVVRCEENYVGQGDWAHAAFSRGVDVEVFGLELVAEPGGAVSL